MCQHTPTKWHCRAKELSYKKKSERIVTYLTWRTLCFFNHFLHLDPGLKWSPYYICFLDQPPPIYGSWPWFSFFRLFKTLRNLVSFTYFWVCMLCSLTFCWKMYAWSSTYAHLWVIVILTKVFCVTILPTIATVIQDVSFDNQFMFSCISSDANDMSILLEFPIVSIYKNIISHVMYMSYIPDNRLPKLCLRLMCNVSWFFIDLNEE